MAFTLGLRHGFDLDHIATIDSITRAVKTNIRLSKYVGFLFSLGHGLVVITMSLIIGSGFIQTQTQMPIWLEAFGNWISIFFLFLFGVITFWNLLPNSKVIPVGIRSVVFKKIFKDNYNPAIIMFIGALFALSFDTFTQVALLSISASVLRGCFFTAILGIVFMIGMMTTDGLNGIFVSSLLQSADKKSSVISCAFGVLIGSFSLTLGVISLFRQFGQG